MITLEQFKVRLGAFDAHVRTASLTAVKVSIKAGADAAKTHHRWVSRTGETVDSIEDELAEVSADRMRGVVWFGGNALRLDEGTPAHAIWPKVRRGFEGPLRAGQSRRRRGEGSAVSTLAFEVGGRTVFAAHVNHPGTAADPYIEAAGDVASQVAMDTLMAGIDAALEAL